jgi:hypothetical protein
MSLINCFAWYQSDHFTAIKIVMSKQSKKGSMKDCYIADIKGLVGINA